VRRDGKPLAPLVVEALLDYIELNMTTTTKTDAQIKSCTEALLQDVPKAEWKDLFVEFVAGR
jgi:hypothetical protein